MSKGDRLALCFFVDALGSRMAERHGCFRTLAPHSYKQRTVLGYSCAAQPTILTGLMPSEHGHWGMFYRTENSELAGLRHMRLLPSFVSGHPRFRRRLLHYHRRRSGFTGYYNFYRIPFELFASFDIVEKKDIYAPRAFDPDVHSVFDRLEDRGVPYRSWSWKTGLDRGLEELTEEIRTRRSRFVLFYTPHIDGFLHGNMGRDEVIARELSTLEGKILRVVEEARKCYSQVDMLVYSDHGMIETTGSFDLMRALHDLELAEGGDYQVFYDSTMARFWFAHDGARTEMVDALSSIDRGRILSDDYLKREGIFFEDGRFGELIFLMDPGVIILPSHMGATAPAGMHGFSPDHEDSHAVLMSNSKIDPAPEHIRDTYRAMMSLVD